MYNQQLLQQQAAVSRLRRMYGTKQGRLRRGGVEANASTLG